MFSKPVGDQLRMYPTSSLKPHLVAEPLGQVGEIGHVTGDLVRLGRAGLGADDGALEAKEGQSSYLHHHHHHHHNHPHHFHSYRHFLLLLTIITIITIITVIIITTIIITTPTPKSSPESPPPADLETRVIGAALGHRAAAVVDHPVGHHHQCPVLPQRDREIQQHVVVPAHQSQAAIT
jgi:hypothetical protein